jgi:2,3-bisphosphoglycerate-independent phosphoglycerate mutase
MKKPVVLIIMDGFGIDAPTSTNAIAVAKKPNIDRIWANYPHTFINASGNAVGLPETQMGNSEVGHMNLGAGRIVYQSLTRINKSIEDGEFAKNESILHAIENAKKNNSKLHIFGLASEGGVHSHVKHIKAIAEVAKQNGIDKVYYHAFLDGRDVPPTSANLFLDKILEQKNISIATVSGRYYAMDRDKNWNRIQKAYDAMCHAKGNVYQSAREGIEASYKENVTDEFMVPFIVDKDGQIEDNDSIIFANFRPDRAIQIATAFSNPEACASLVKNPDDPKLDVTNAPKNIFFVSMMKYSDTVKGEIAFPIVKLTNMLGDILAKNNKKQLRIAETEKYAHVTFFFDGGEDREIEGEDRILVNSPKVATYDLQPEMSAYEVTDKVIPAIKSLKYDTIILNYANCDMVGHTGVIEAAVKATEVVDECVGKVVAAIEEVGGVALITADHGNAEKMRDAEGNPYTAHTTNPVPLIVTDKSLKLRLSGILSDITPTMLELLEIEKPVEMTSKSLILHD